MTHQVIMGYLCFLQAELFPQSRIILFIVFSFYHGQLQLAAPSSFPLGPPNFFFPFLFTPKERGKGTKPEALPEPIPSQAASRKALGPIPGPRPLGWTFNPLGGPERLLRPSRGPDYPSLWLWQGRHSALSCPISCQALCP